MLWAHVLTMGGSMANPSDYREIMKAHFRYNETRTVEEVLAEQKARQDDGPQGVSKTPPPLGRAATMSELDAARALMGSAKPENYAPGE